MSKAVSSFSGAESLIPAGLSGVIRFSSVAASGVPGTAGSAPVRMGSGLCGAGWVKPGLAAVCAGKLYG
jgi:hypothetical protein